MPLTTTVYLHDQAGYRIVFAGCAELAGATTRTRTRDEGSMVFTDLGEGGAWPWRQGTR